MKQRITGYNAIESYLTKKGGNPTLYTSGAGKRGLAIIRQAREMSIPVITVPEKELDSMAEGDKHRGLILIRERTEENRQGSFFQFLDSSESRESIILMLDGIQDPHNLGAIIRSVDQFSGDCVLLPENRSVKPNKTVSRTAVGADAFVPLYIVKNISRSIDACKKAGYWVYGADFEGEPLSQVSFPAKTVLIMGGEGKGLHRLIKEKCDTLVRIPGEGHVDSLNVSVAAGILLYEIHRQRQSPA